MSDPLARLANEGVRINDRKPEELLNSRFELGDTEADLPKICEIDPGH